MVDDALHVLPEYRLEIQLIGHIEVGRDRLGVAVDHDGLVAHLLNRQQPVYAAVVEFYPLPNAIGAGAEYDDFLFITDLAFILVLEGRIEVRRLCLELCRTSVYHLVSAHDAE